MKREVEETELRAIFASSPDAITTSDLNGNITDCNQATLDLHGYSSKEELIGKSASELIANKDHKRAMENLKKTLEQGSVRNIEYTFLAKNGREFPAELSASVVKDSSGNPTGFVAVTKDITERKQMEAELRESEEKYRTQFEEALDAIFLADTETGIIIDCNRAASELVGREKKELVGKHQRILHPPEEIEVEFSRTFKQHIKEKEGQVLKAQVITKKGQIKDVAIKANVFELKGKKIIQGIFRDVTEREKMDEKLRESEERFRNLYESVKDPLVVWVGKEGRLIEYNKAFKEQTGYTDEELKDKTFLDFTHPDDHAMVLEKYRTRYSEEDFPLVYEIRVLNKKGEIIPLEISVSPYKVKGKVIGVEAIGRDITERKKAEEELIRLSSAVKMSTDSIVIGDIDAKIIDVNEATLKMYGTDDKKDLIGKNSFDLIAPEEREKALAGMEEALEKGYIKSREYHIITKDGGRIPVEMSVAIMKDADYNPTGFVGISRDITDRKRAEETLRVSEGKFRGIFESASDCMIYVDRSGRILDVNRKAVEVFGGSKKELLGEHFAKVGVVSPRDIPKLVTAFAKGLAGKKATLDICIKNKKGQEIPLECSNSLMKIDDKFAGLLVIARDVTERKKMEEKLGESEERFRNLFESIQDPLAVYVGREGRLIEYNETFKKRSGYTDEELKDKTFLDFVHPDDYAMVLERYRTRYPEEELPLIYEIRGVTKKGQILPIEISVSTYKKKGRVIGIEVIQREITERKKMEEKLRQYSEHLEELVQKRTEELLESEKRYSVLVEEASDGVAIIQDKKIVFANKRSPEIVGYSRDEIIGVPFEKLVDEKYRQLAKEIYEERLLGEKFPATLELELIAETGERVPVELSGTRINYQGRPAVLIIVRDISERKRMEEQRMKLERLATMGELATMVGHDLRNPLQSIENATYYLNNELPSLPPSTPIPQKALEMLQVINNSVNYADKIIKDLHDFSATKKPTLKKTHINTIIKETLSQVETPENVELITELGHLPKIKADKDMIKRIFLNLAINGIQAMEKGGTLKVSTKKTKGFVEVSFKDTGAGIPKENMKKIFTPFFTTRAKGMGMGLPICNKLVEIHGGSIEVESEERKGSIFTVKLPIQQEKRR